LTASVVSALTTVFALLAMVFGFLTRKETEEIFQRANVTERPKRALHIVFGILVLLASVYCTLILFQHR